MARTTSPDGGDGDAVVDTAVKVADKGENAL